MGYLAGGLRVTPTLHAGAELSGWFDETNDVHQRLLLYGASLWWHPQAGKNWFLKGGVGLMNYHAGTGDDDDDPLSATAAALQLGAGYDLRAGRKLWFSPFANMIVTSSGNLTSGNTIITGASFSLLQLGAGLTWRWGSPADHQVTQGSPHHDPIARRATGPGCGCRLLVRLRHESGGRDAEPCLRHLESRPERELHQGAARRLRGGGAGRQALPDLAPAPDPGGCSFGHEHGRDPRGSDLYGEAGWHPLRLRQRAARP